MHEREHQEEQHECARGHLQRVEVAALAEQLSKLMLVGSAGHVPGGTAAASASR